MIGHGEKLSRKQELAIAALISAGTIKEAAQNCGISEATLWRWLQKPEFQTAYRAARRQLVEHAISELQAAMGEAVMTLRRNLNCGNRAVETRCAQLIIAFGQGGVELIDLQQRIGCIELMLQEQHEEERLQWG